LQLDNVRWLFAMLMIFDIVTLICPDTTGRRVGEKMEERIRRIVRPGFEGTKFDVEVASGNFDEWSRHGYKLNTLCQQLGREHCLFFFHTVLTSGL
jgi:hypothetical protein